jgi:hypothetical protein
MEAGILRRFIDTAGRRRLVVVALCVAVAAVFGSIALAAPMGLSSVAKGKTGDVWDSHGTTTVDIGGFANIDVAQITVPKGTFLLTAKTTVKNNAAAGNFECRIRDGGGNLDDAATTTEAAFKSDNLAMTALVTYTATTTTVSLTCSADAGTATWWHLDALKIGKVR